MDDRATFRKNLRGVMRASNTTGSQYYMGEFLRNNPNFQTNNIRVLTRNRRASFDSLTSARNINRALPRIHHNGTESLVNRSSRSYITREFRQMPTSATRSYRRSLSNTIPKIVHKVKNSSSGGCHKYRYTIAPNDDLYTITSNIRSREILSDYSENSSESTKMGWTDLANLIKSQEKFREFISESLINCSAARSFSEGNNAIEPQAEKNDSACKCIRCGKNMEFNHYIKNGMTQHTEEGFLDNISEKTYSMSPPFNAGSDDINQITEHLERLNVSADSNNDNSPSDAITEIDDHDPRTGAWVHDDFNFHGINPLTGKLHRIGNEKYMQLMNIQQVPMTQIEEDDVPEVISVSIDDVTDEEFNRENFCDSPKEFN